MKAYSYDLRKRIFSYSLNHSIRETAKVFQVSPNTVFLLIKLYAETGDLHPREKSTEYCTLISKEGEMYLASLLIGEPDLTLAELCDLYEEAYGVKVCISTMYNTLKKMNITRKKKTFSDPKKDTEDAKAEKLEYDTQLDAIEPSKRLYLDETGSCLNMSPPYGRSQRGKRAYDKKPSYPSDTVSTVAILSERGITATYTYSSSLTADLFVVYLGKFVLPILEDGQTLIMDRHPVHRSKMVRNYLEKNNIRFLYLPPYSPMLNPIEEAFSKIKQYIKKQKARTINDLMPVLKNAFEIITGNDANGYFNHAAEF